MLHHQETLYPVTYAALPWLFDVAKRTPEAAVDLGVFFSQVIYCAGFPEQNKTSCYNGLCTVPSQHHHSWIEPSQRLRDADAKMLGDLEHWFDQNKKEMADFAVGVSKTAKPEEVGYLLRGYAALADAFSLVQTLEAAGGSDGWIFCPACGNDGFLAVWEGDTPVFEAYVRPENLYRDITLDDLEDNIPDVAQLEINWKAARNLADLVRAEQPDIARFLDVFSTWRCCEDVPQPTLNL